EKSPVFSKGFVEEQQKKTEADEPDEFYDLTSWSLPLAMNVETYVTTAPITAAVQPYAAAAVPAVRPAAYGYVVDGNDPYIYRLAGRMLRSKVKFSVSDDVVTVGERTYGRGTLVILRGNNAADLDTAIDRLARETGAEVVPIESGWTGTTSFGSE